MARKPTYEELEQRLKELENEVAKHKRAKEKLRLFSQAVDSSSDGIAMGNLEGRITYANKEFIRVFGYSREELIGQEIAFIYAEDQIPMLKEALKATMEGGWAGELVGKRKDGGVIPIAISASRVVDEEGKVIAQMASYQDITERKLAEDALKESGRYSRGLIEASPDALVTISADGKITDVNQATELITGVSRKKIIGTDFSNYFTDPEAARKGYQKVFRQNHVRDYPLEIKHRDGRVISVLYNASVYKDAQGRIAGVFAAARDITERKRAEEALKKAHDELELRVEKRTAELSKANEQLKREIEDRKRVQEALRERTGQLQVAYDQSIIYAQQLNEEIAERKRAEEALRDKEQEKNAILNSMLESVLYQDTEHRVVWANRAAGESVGLTPEELTGRHCYEIWHNRSKPCEGCPVVKVRETGQPQEAEMTSPNGGVWSLRAYPFRDGTDNITGVVEAALDVTKRKRAEEALLESEERYCILTKYVADGVMLTQDGRLLFVNDAFVSMFGYTHSEQLLGKEFLSLISNGFRERFREMQQELEARISREGFFQGMCLSQDGQEFWVEVHNSIIKWKGKPAVLGTVRDITEIRLQEIATREEAENLRRENIKLRSTMKDRFRFGNIIGKSPAMQQVYELILRASASDASVLISGESGTGKELVAQAIHDTSERHEKAFVPINCGAIPETLLESEFFGHKKGAFTGAHTDKHGYLDFADGGTLFLDEVGDLGLNIQVKLLRAIEGGGHTPLGSGKTKMSDFRIIAATNKNLMDQVNTGLMRKDFFYRIHIIPITLPPLRDRREDILLLIEHFMQSHNHDKKPRDIPVKIMEAMYNYDWPGNIRELQNVLHRYFIIGRLDFMDTSTPQSVDQGDVLGKDSDQKGLDFRATVENFERGLIVKALDEAQWKRTKVASMLGVPRRTLSRKMKRFGLM